MLGEITKTLSVQDPVLGRVFRVIPELSIIEPEPCFDKMASIIISQQLSLKAASTIKKRLIENIGTLTPSSVSEASEQIMRSCGISKAKTNYMKLLADHFLNDSNFLDRLLNLKDEDVISEVEALKGFGPWSSRIFVLFHLGRPNVFPHGDATLTSAINFLYGIDPKDHRLMNSVIKKWEPYKSIACRAIWQWHDNGRPQI